MSDLLTDFDVHVAHLLQFQYSPLTLRAGSPQMQALINVARVWLRAEQEKRRRGRGGRGLVPGPVPEKDSEEAFARLWTLACLPRLERQVDLAQERAGLDVTKAGVGQARLPGAGVNQPQADGAGGVAPHPPKVYLATWAAILTALGLKPSQRAHRDTVTRLNKEFDGPIRLAMRGGQPLAEKAALLSWWNRLEQLAEARRQKAENVRATVADQHPYGREGRAAPEINGEVKKRRAPRPRT
jgi:hypothetical protein